MTDEELYELAFAELKEQRTVQSVWAKAFAEADGEERKTAARYIALRVEGLRGESGVEAGHAGHAPRWSISGIRPGRWAGVGGAAVVAIWLWSYLEEPEGTISSGVWAAFALAGAGFGLLLGYVVKLAGRIDKAWSRQREWADPQSWAAAWCFAGWAIGSLVFWWRGEYDSIAGAIGAGFVVGLLSLLVGAGVAVVLNLLMRLLSDP